MAIKLVSKLILLVACFCLLLVHGIPKNPNDVHEKLQTQQKHFRGEEHDPNYDHEAFLGQETEEFDNLTQEESQRRLGLIVKKIDKNNDGFVTKDELKSWIIYTQKRYIMNDVENHWKNQKVNNEGKLSWAEYRKDTYGFMSDEEANVAQKQDDSYTYAKMILRDKRRWAAADLNHDGLLTKDEFVSFLHPEESNHMKDIVVYETMDDMDKDKDNKISIKEYIEDLFPGIEENEEPSFVISEKEQFKTYRDKDGDGFLDIGEVKDWILPENFDHAEAESRHLIYESDADADGKLTNNEIITKYDLFVGSQATDFGEAILKHEEL
ncbi:calumenin-A [Daktulosphaira vitifoliae]|uniref:calumenin-A n=1 Tax=Daktulosphaira vitifoliae TaxID=58002 RepID=UPI0021A9F792|nr:calumenin-A [Daktulosphaira vitifoliae]